MGDILFLAHRVPFPPDRGDKMRSFHILKHLGRSAPVHLIAFADDARDAEYGEQLARWTASRTVVRRSKSRGRAMGEALLTGAPASVTAFGDRRVRDAVKRILAGRDIDTIYVFSGQMAQYLPETHAARVVMDFVDMDSAKFAAYANSARWPLKWVHQREARLLGRFERHVAARVDVSLFVSAAEAELFSHTAPDARVEAVENGIDTRLYDPDGDFAALEAPGPLIVFTGQMDYRPNVEAVRWFAGHVLPHIRQSHAAARFAIVGRNPGEAVRALAKLPGVTVTGEVADVRGWLAAASVAVAPLTLARGVQNKVLEAMAMARPVVASPAAACGIDHGGTICVAEGERGFGDAVIALLDDPAAARAQGEAARRRTIERYGWSARLAVLDRLIGSGGAA
ncbi:TIGR03087 family PEP-CTERM/XrtA system glycosyltransferase [Stakelama pacifica]|uniref:Sugar transferase (PEP-CTERM/EpsH1 system associated) n=1 Tax=Stakelama pacifica TaxID=517720 RepID=A0A4R6FF50_9SPHN|nr:TIGR03087 family PEP-CTERM/XrtA system glycosyltransferase [Stakelama pacifica]TDN79872.1 sugar transferase (PEP-CTERM/EpsH1 system associated) [Stakelama pacifica]GGO98070.1 glycosyl transferase [Stakelama pacifica]